MLSDPMIRNLASTSMISVVLDTVDHYLLLSLSVGFVTPTFCGVTDSYMATLSNRLWFTYLWGFFCLFLFAFWFIHQVPQTEFQSISLTSQAPLTLCQPLCLELNSAWSHLYSKQGSQWIGTGFLRISLPLVCPLYKTETWYQLSCSSDKSFLSPVASSFANVSGLVSFSNHLSSFAATK